MAIAVFISRTKRARFKSGVDKESLGVDEFGHRQTQHFAPLVQHAKGQVRGFAFLPSHVLYRDAQVARHTFARHVLLSPGFAQPMQRQGTLQVDWDHGWVLLFDVGPRIQGLGAIHEAPSFIRYVATGSSAANP
jgi:hypothetical protein